ncbi:MAG: glycine zipper family protein [Oxalobacter sp.]|nr:MAG: glycine zipper family protein [Oxalobacter sp.]
MKKWFAPFLLASLVLLLTACAGYRPIVDMKGVDKAQYEKDLKECQEYAEQVNVAGETAAGGAIGAGIGGAIGAVSGGRAGVGAAVGAITGTATGAGKATSGQKQVINRCLAGRGYRVLR